MTEIPQVKFDALGVPELRDEQAGRNPEVQGYQFLPECEMDTHRRQRAYQELDLQGDFVPFVVEYEYTLDGGPETKRINLPGLPGHTPTEFWDLIDARRQDYIDGYGLPADFEVCRVEPDPDWNAETRRFESPTSREAAAEIREFVRNLGFSMYRVEYRIPGGPLDVMEVPSDAATPLELWDRMTGDHAKQYEHPYGMPESFVPYRIDFASDWRALQQLDRREAA